ncbi:protein ECERIFERUM 16 [Pyrus x bretschneideri]|uniref:protein ECERIFERUM 16 n=1 Tax=Pyrus x bretschneideri TaxID=225117 RepID=UPI00202DBCB8|nr:protein ECERIFERUM 16 [Pyrus x bretschneideri]
MDAKALAKSKRAHSEHHSKKYHPKPKAKSSAVGGGKGNEAGTARNPLGKEVQEKTHPTKGASALPSNWDRYEEELDLGSEDPVPAADGSNRASDVVVPKSKGADFCHLIDEARSQSQSIVYLDTFPGLENDLLGEWNKGIETMLSVRGESVLSRIGDDNFVVEDKNAAAPHEVSFLSLNLHSLAEQLEKIDLPQRLFIEADLLPPELYAEQTTCDEEVARRLPEESPCSDFSEEVQVPDHDIEIMVSDSPTDPKLGNSEYEHKLPESETQASVKSFEPSTAEADGTGTGSAS